jgi:hypothetical protein
MSIEYRNFFISFFLLYGEFKDDEKHAFYFLHSHHSYTHFLFPVVLCAFFHLQYIYTSTVLVDAFAALTQTTASYLIENLKTIMHIGCVNTSSCYVFLEKNRPSRS